MAVDGPAGSGKSFTALRFAFALAARGGGRVCCIDTEAGSLSLYQGDAPDGVPFDFDVLELLTYSPVEYTSAIEEAGRSGYDVLVIDSLSHGWTGRGGVIEMKDRIGGNSFAAWKDLTPLQDRMIESILTSPLHVIATLRSKMEYILDRNEQGKQEPRRVGMAPIQRPNLEYEFTIFASLDQSHTMTVTKSRCSAVQNAVVVKPDASFMKPIIDWLERGEAAPLAGPQVLRASDDQVRRIVELLTAAGIDMDKARREHLRRFGVAEVKDLKPAEADEVIRRLERTAKPVAPAASVMPTTPATSAAPAAPAAPASNGATASGPSRIAGSIRPDQADQLTKLKDELTAHGLTDQKFGNALKKRGATKLSELSEATAQQLIESMQSQLTLKEMEAQAAADRERFENGEPAAAGDEKSTGAAP
jgi:hypothetical protein